MNNLRLYKLFAVLWLVLCFFVGFISFQGVYHAEDKSTHGNSFCPVVYENERFITREETSKLLHVDYSTLWRWNKLGLLCPNKVGPRRVMYKYSDVMKKLNGEQKGEDDAERC